MNTVLKENKIAKYMDFGGTWPESGENENRLIIIRNDAKAHHKPIGVSK